ncbi:serine carboxypeptidase S28-domain-containing protein [Pisolithus marmoratus]|nr:serine carboxypeptidase S28-domain-containing protein [Pisolithus marmoratus]
MTRAFVVAAVLAACAHAAIPDAMLRAIPVLPPISAPEGQRTTPNGTFEQRYWMDWEYYKPGGPVILMTPGEVNAQNYTGHLTNDTINGLIAQQQNGATIVIEHRFFGLSNPYPDLSSQSLAVLTIQQAIDDLVYFAQQANLPMPGGDNVKPDTTPWILIGGSYSGALTAWTMVKCRRSHHGLLGIL